MGVVEGEVSREDFCFRGIDSAGAGPEIENGVIEGEVYFKVLYGLANETLPEKDFKSLFAIPKSAA
jgi:hypothetical protein